MKSSQQMPMLEEDEVYVSTALDFMLNGKVSKEAKQELEKVRTRGYLK